MRRCYSSEERQQSETGTQNSAISDQTNQKVNLASQRTPRKTTMKSQSFLKRPATTMTNRFETFNPLYTQEEQDPLATTREKETEPMNKSMKETKRSEKTTREAIKKITKDNNEVLENQINELGNKMNEKDKNMTEGLNLINEVIGNLAGQIGDLVKHLKENNTKESSQTEQREKEGQIEQYKGRNDNNEQPEKMQEETDKQDTENTEERTQRQTENSQRMEDQKMTRQILENMNKRIKTLEEENKKQQMINKQLNEKIEMKSKINEDKLTERTTKQTPKKQTLKPAININMSGTTEQTEQIKDTYQPLDYAGVVTARRQQQPKQVLSISTHEEVHNNLKNHNEQTKQKINENEIKMKKPKNITKKEKEKIVETMLDKASCTIGIAPIPKDHVRKVCEELTQKNVLKKTEDYPTRLQRTVKSLVKSWTKKHMGIEDEDWNEIKVKKITQTNAEESDVIYITLETIEDTTKITSKANKLPKTNNETDPRLVMYVDQRSRKRYNAIQNIAMTLRQKSKNTIQTSIRNGRRDFLLRQKLKGDMTPWNKVPPIKLEENLPDFEVGNYQNIYEDKTDENIENEEKEEEDTGREKTEEMNRFIK